MSSPRLLRRARTLALGLTVIPLVGLTLGVGPVTAAASGSGSTRQISSSGTTSFTATAPGGDGVQSPEIFAQADGGAGVAVNRSHSSPGTTPGATTQPRPLTNSTPGLVTSFDALNHRQNRLADNGHQFSLEPPDQGLCVGTDGSGHTRVMEALNDVLRVYDTAGAAQTAPIALNPFFHEGHAIIRTPLPRVYGEFETDPACLFDASSGHWFLDDLALDVVPSGPNGGNFTGGNHLNLAVSQTSDPLGAWTIYRIPVQDDGTPGTSGTPNHHCSAGAGPPPTYRTNPTACFGDFPHIGSDANGIYLTTNEYSFFGPEFHGAQIYALSKAELASLAPSITVTQFDTHGLDTFGFARNGFTLWPSTTPGGGGDSAAGGTEYFLSSNAGAEAHDTGDGTSIAHPSTQLLVWAIGNTSSLNGTPALIPPTVAKVDVGLYAPPPLAEQKAGSQPLRECLNNNKCSTFLTGIKDPFAEKASGIDSSDTRILTTEFVNGQLWGALDTAVSTGNAKEAGIEWFQVTPSNATGTVSAGLAKQGYVALGNDNLAYPSIGITSGGSGVMGFTIVGPSFYPSAGYATIGSAGVGAIHIAAPGVGPEDGFTNYKLFGNPPRPRWGDYGAAVPMGSNVWLASEYIGESCTLPEYQSAPFGSCGGTRTALANWGTRISEISVP